MMANAVIVEVGVPRRDAGFTQKCVKGATVLVDVDMLLGVYVMSILNLIVEISLLSDNWRGE